MEKEFVSYEQALELKHLGFDLPCFAWFDSFDCNNLHTWRVPDTMVKPEFIKDSVVAPIYQQVFDWFRITHNIFVEISSNSGGFYLFFNDSGYVYDGKDPKLFENYSDVRNEAVDLLIDKLERRLYGN